MTLKIFDLFSGCGGFRQAFKKAGCEIVGYCEINKYAVKLYKAFYSPVNEVYFNDAASIITDNLPRFDILTAGFPCQSYSIAGARKGFHDIRGSLFFEVARILRDCKPKYFLLENVKGLFNIAAGRTFITIIKTLTDLGYSVSWCLLNSRYFGLPQNRERIFIVGSLNKESSKKIFPLSAYEGKNIKKSKKLLLYWKNSIDKWVIENRSYVPTIKTQSDLSRQKLLIDNINISDYTRIGILRTHKDNFGFRTMKDNISPTIAARARNDGSGLPVLIIPEILKGNIEVSARRLTPLECFRLQGFNDDIVKKAYEIGISDAQLYKMAGN